MKVENILSNKKEQLFIYFLLVIVFIISIKEIYGIHYTTADDVVSEVYQDILTLEDAIEKGVRITYFMNSFLFTYIFNFYLMLLNLTEFEVFLTKATVILSHILLITSILSRSLNYNTANPLVFLLCLLSVQNYWEHHLVTAFPVIGIAFTTLLISLLLFLSKNIYLFLISGILFIVSCLLYEVFISFYPVFILLAFNKRTNNKFDYIYITIITLLFLLSYISFSSISNLSYPGAIVSNYNLKEFVEAIYIYATSNIPGMMIFKTESLISLLVFGDLNHLLSIDEFIDLIRIEWIIKILAIYIVINLSYNKLYLPSPKFKSMLMMFGISISFIIGPNILIALSDLHRGWAINGSTTVYTGSYFSGFGYSILLLFCIFLLMPTKLRFLKNRNIIIFLLVSLLSLVSLNVDISNHYVKLAQAGDMRLWNSVDRLLEDNYNQVRNKTICAPTLWQRGHRQGLFHPQSMDSYWNDYASVKYNKTINFNKNVSACEYILEFTDNYATGEYALLINEMSDNDITRMTLLDYKLDNNQLIYAKYADDSNQFAGYQIVEFKKNNTSFSPINPDGFHSKKDRYHFISKDIKNIENFNYLDSSNAINDRYFIYGWSGRENWGRWTTSKKSLLYLPIYVDNKMSLNIKVRRHPLFANNDKYTVCVNDICNIYDYSDKEIQFDYYPNDIQEQLIISFETHKIIKPNSSDVRKLGIGIENISIKDYE
jgi:hypothetical protein